MFYNRFARYPIYERFEKIAYFIADRVEEIQNRDFTEERRRKLENQITKELIYQYAERNLISLYQDFLSGLSESYPVLKRSGMNPGKSAMKIFWQSFICRFISMAVSRMTISNIW